MATTTLWERIHGSDNVYNSTDIEDQKIALHRFWGMVHEWEQGYETQTNIIAAFSLAVGTQRQQAAVIKQHINAAPDKVAFIRVCKDWSYVAENNLDPTATKYLDFAQFTQRMSDEVTDQGGTAP